MDPTISDHSGPTLTESFMGKFRSIPILPLFTNGHRGNWKRGLWTVSRLKYINIRLLLVLALFLTLCYHMSHTSKSKSKKKQPCLDFLNLDGVYEKAIGNYPSDEWEQKKLLNDSTLQLKIGELMPRPNSFFFVESSGSSSISLRSACAIESAAMLHPNSQVYLVLTSPMIKVKSVDHLAKTYKNIHYRYVNVKAILRGTQLEKLWKNGKIHSSQFVVSHLSDILRFALLWRFGGTYVDTDMIFIKPLPDESQYPNLIAKERDAEGHVGSAIMRFQFGHPLMSRMQSYLASNFDGQAWGENGPLAITRVILDMCGVENIMEVNTKKCYELTVLPPSAFFALDAGHWRDIFNHKKREEVLQVLNQSYTLHMWGRNSRAHQISATLSANSSAYDIIAAKSCPVSYSSNFLKATSTL